MSAILVKHCENQIYFGDLFGLYYADFLKIFCMSDFSQFIGRFHPLLVHLPIGMLLLAVLLTFINPKQHLPGWHQAIKMTWLFGAITAFVSVLLGWQLANGGGYNDQDLFWHRWLGILTMIFSATGWWMSRNWPESNKSNLKVVGVLTTLLLVLTGHLGGNLTHGRGYLLAYAPFGNPAPVMDSIQSIDKPLDSIFIYDDLIRPVFEKKCFDCHSDENQEGGLVMSDEAKLMEGGDHGEVIQRGKPLDSELLVRVTLPRNDQYFMPLKGEAMTYQEIRLLEWWIAEKADFQAKLSDVETPESIKQILLNFGIDLNPKPLVERLTAPPVSAESLDQLKSLGYALNLLSSDSHLIEITWPRKPLGKDTLEALLSVKEQITWLNLGRSNLTDEALSIIAQMPNLTRLRLEQNPIKGNNLSPLKSLPHLESLNLFGTEIGDDAVEDLKEMPALARVFLWQSNFTQEGIDALANARPDLDINFGYSGLSSNGN